MTSGVTTEPERAFVFASANVLARTNAEARFKSARRWWLRGKFGPRNGLSIRRDALIKCFVVDVSNVKIAGRTAAMMTAGVVLRMRWDESGAMATPTRARYTRDKHW